MQKHVIPYRICITYIFSHTRIQAMKFPTLWGYLNMESTPLFILGLILVASSLKGEATPALGKIVAPGQIENPQVEEIEARSGM